MTPLRQLDPAERLKLGLLTQQVLLKLMAEPQPGIAKAERFDPHRPSIRMAAWSFGSDSTEAYRKALSPDRLQDLGDEEQLQRVSHMLRILATLIVTHRFLPYHPRIDDAAAWLGIGRTEYTGLLQALLGYMAAQAPLGGFPRRGEPDEGFE